jgi:asparagine synthase (glutamine-hydrolysing)
MRHESFYVSGKWSDERLGVYVGWTARENSFSDGMPLRNERGDVVLIFGGEEYAEPGTAQRLKERGHECEPQGPSYLVHLYEEDKNFPKNLNGRFQGLVADCARGKLVLFNDRFGLQRVYYHENQDAFYFSAEAKAILKVRPELRSIDARGMSEYISCGCVLEGRTLFKGIQTLPPGSAWEFLDGALAKRAAYFEPREWEEQEPLDPEAYYTLLRDAFTNALPRYFKGPEKIGVSLTGEFNTKIIMSLRNTHTISLPCYNLHSM